MIKDFKSTKKNCKSKIYLPMELYNVLTRHLKKANIEFTGIRLHDDLLRGKMQTPNELKKWQTRFENDGYEKTFEGCFDAIESYYDPEDLYKYAQNFFGPTIDPDYKKEIEESLEFNKYA